MKSWLVKMSTPAEIAMVTLICFGYPIFKSTLLLIRTLQPTLTIFITTPKIFFLVAIELLSLAIAYCFLRQRSWTIDRLNLGFNLKNTLRGLAVFIISFLVALSCGAVAISIASYFSFLDQISLHNVYIINASFIAKGVLCVVNPIFEECALFGYLFPAVAAISGNKTAILYAIIVKLLYHTYLGPLVVFTNVPMTLIYCFFYIKWKKVWPLVVAHGLVNSYNMFVS